MPYSTPIRTSLMAGILCLFTNWSKAKCGADLNGNAIIDNDDLLILLADYGTSCDEATWDDPVISEIHYNPSTQQGADNSSWAD